MVIFLFWNQNCSECISSEHGFHPTSPFYIERKWQQRPLHYPPLYGSQSNSTKHLFCKITQFTTSFFETKACLCYESVTKKSGKGIDKRLCLYLEPKYRQGGKPSREKRQWRRAASEAVLAGLAQGVSWCSGLLWTLLLRLLCYCASRVLDGLVSPAEPRATQLN